MSKIFDYFMDRRKLDLFESEADRDCRRYHEDQDIEAMRRANSKRYRKQY